MHLNERKIKILEAIITDYIKTGEPIGSRTIAKKYDLGISSATIRNEMSDLEELGFIIQPYTSSGRVPSNKGYRLYVDNIMSHRDLTSEELFLLKDLIKNNVTQIDSLMEQTAKAISLLTNYTAVVSKPKLNKDIIKNIQLIYLDESSIVAVLVTEAKLVNNYIINTPKPLSSQEILTLNQTLTSILQKYSIGKNQKDISHILKNYNLKDFEYRIIEQIFTQVLKTLDESEIFTSGVGQILKFPEFSDLKIAQDIFDAFEEKKVLIDIFDSDDNNQKSSIQILIGDENSIEPLKNCSVVKTEYKIDGAIGTIALIGPTRMDYTQAVSVLNGIVENINKMINALETNKKEGGNYG